MPVPRTEVTAAPLRGEIVVAGGFLRTGANSRRVDAYAPARATWRRLPDIPVSVDHAAAAAWRGQMVVVGGYGADRNPLRTAFAFDGRRWRRLPPPPEPRAAAAAAALPDGRIVVVGGVDGTGLAATTLVLDLGTLAWTTIAGPRPREHLAAAALDGRVYAVGGRLAGIDTNLTAVDVLDPATGTWQEAPPLPAARGGTGATAIGGEIVSAGGEEPPGTIASVFAFSPKTRRWRRLPDLPTSRHGLGVVSLAGRVWVVAGGPEPGLTVSGAVESLGPA